MKTYFKILAVLYFTGAALHISDLLNFRLNFSEMNITWKIWIVYLTAMDIIAAFGLWKNKTFGEVTFLTIAFSQLIAYLFFQRIFGNQTPLVIFHIVTILVYLFLKFKPRRKNAR